MGGGQARSAPRIVRSTPSVSADTSSAASRKRRHTPLPATLARCRPPPQGGRGERDDPCIPGAHAAGGRLPSPRPSPASGRGVSTAGGSTAGGNSRLSSDLPVNNRQRTGAYFLDCNHEVQTCPAGRSPRAVARRPGRPSFCICQPRASRRPFRRKTIREIYYIQTGLCPQGFFARDVTLEPSSAGAAIARNGIRRPLAHRHDRVWPLGPYLRTTACT